MKRKILNGLAILTSLFGYLEWRGHNRIYLFQGEWEVLNKLINDPVSAAHPFTLFPLFGQVGDYTLHARSAIEEMHRQMGDSLVFDDDGLLRRGLLVRLLVLPNDIAGIEDSLCWIREELSPHTAVSLMAQYYATNKAATDRRYILLSRRISEGEWFKAVSLLEGLGLQEGFMQEYASASYYYRPDFNDSEKPFKDIRDFA